MSELQLAVALRQASLDELVSRRRDQDLRIGQRTRAFVSVLLGLFWSVTPGLEYFLAPSRSTTEAFLVYGSIPAASVLLLTALSVWARESLTRTRVNRLMLVALYLALIGHLAVLGGFALLGLPPLLHFVVMLLVWAAISAMTAFVIERRTAPIPIGCLLGFFVAAAMPEHTLLVVAVCNFVFLLVVAVLWWPERLRGPIPEPDHRA